MIQSTKYAVASFSAVNSPLDSDKSSAGLNVVSVFNISSAQLETQRRHKAKANGGVGSTTQSFTCRAGISCSTRSTASPPCRTAYRPRSYHS